MANEDIGKIYKDLTDLAIDTNELQNDKTIPNIIKKLDDLRKTAVSYDGEIARILPIQLKYQIDNLKALETQIESVSKTVATNLNSLSQVLTTIPWGKLVGTEALDIPNISNNTAGSSLPQTNASNIATDNNGVAPQAPVTINSDGDIPPSDQPKSAMIQNESTLWNELKGRFAGSAMPGGEANNGGFFNKMKESFSRMDFGLDSLNEVQDDSKKTFWESLTSSLPRSSTAFDIGKMAENQDISRGGHYVEDSEVHFGETVNDATEHFTESMEMPSGDSFDFAAAADAEAGNDDLNPAFDGYIADEGDSFSVVGEED